MIWYKGNLHTHTTNSEDGQSPPEEVCDWYREHGYDFLALTDHDRVTDRKNPISADGLLVIRGEEISGNHLVALNVRKEIDKSLPVQQKVDEVREQGGICFAAHPNWMSDHWPLPLLASTIGYIGLEIYNAHIVGLEGSAYALDKWDQLLWEGHRVWGLASDDLHDLETGLVGSGWVGVYSNELTTSAILDALRRGRFFASTGMEVDAWSTQGGELTIVASHAEEIVFIGRGGRTLAQSSGPRAKYELREGDGYVRVECRGDMGTAYTQPVFPSE